MRLRKSMANKAKAGRLNQDDWGMLSNLKRCIKSRVRASIKRQGQEKISCNDPGQTWKFIRKMTFSQSKGATLLPDINDLNNYFASLVSEEAAQPVSDPTQQLATDSALDHSLEEEGFNISPFDCEQTEKLLKKVKANSSTGPDSIPAFLVKRLAHYISPNITQLYNSSIIHGIFPEQWKEANVVAVYKNKGSRSDVENYRPISVLPILGRVLEKAVCTQLQQYCDANDIIPAQQFGFRKNSSCEYALLAALDTWAREASNGLYVGALLIDLSKAFDSISHSQLAQDLQDIGCNSSSLQWFTSFLSSRRQRVKTGATCSPWISVGKGVPQGSPLSPLLFNIAIRLLPQHCDPDLFQFADDLTNSASDKDLNVLRSKLQTSYEKIKSFCNKKNLAINPTKTQLLILKSPRKIIPEGYSISLDGAIITPSPTVKLLGVILDQHFTMGSHIEAIVKKCHALLGVLRRSATYLPRDVLKLIYVALIRAQLEYASATFANAAPSHLKRLDTLQKIASRIITGSPAHAHSAPLQLQLNLPSLQSRRIRHVASLVENILSGKAPLFFKDFFSSSPTTINSAGTAKPLHNKRFSNYGITFHHEYMNSLGAPARLIHPLTKGQSTEQLTSQQPLSVTNSASPFSKPHQMRRPNVDGCKRLTR